MTVSRRSLLIGASIGAASASVGAGVDRILSMNDLRCAVAEADRSKAAALRQLAQRDGQIETLAVRQGALDAARDKAMAIEQVKAQLPSGRDRSISANFEHLGHARPWLEPLRRSIGYFECYTNGIAYRGAAEILDLDGTLVLCGHEFVHSPQDKTALYVTFFPGAAKACKLPIQMMYVDRAHDIAFATLAPGRSASALREHRLRPVRWSQDGQAAISPNKDVIFVGFPEGIARIHATSGAIRGLRPVNTVNGDGSMSTHDCKIESDGVTFSGMSGGGVFHEGAFVGVVNFSSPAGSAPYTYFTPASAIQAAYMALFPERARAAGVTAPPSNTPPFARQSGCDLDRKGFLTVAYR